MAARRNRYARRRNRGRFGVLYKLLSILVIIAAVLVGCLVFFRVNTMVVSGNSRYTEAEIIAASGVERGDNLYGLNKYQIAGRIYTRLPYVDTVVIDRKPPDTLIFQITESAPVAALNAGGAWWLLDPRCKLLETGDAALAGGRAAVLGLDAVNPAVGSTLTVNPEQQDKLNSLKSLLSAIKDRGMTGSITGFIDLTAENEIRFGYGANLTVIVPMNDDFAHRTFVLKRALESIDERGLERTGTLDLTYGDEMGSLRPERWLPGREEAPAQDPEASPGPAPEAGQGEDDEA